MKSQVLALLALCASAFAFSCSSPPVKPPEYTLGGTVTGLTGTGLVLQDEGAYNITLTKDGPFTFAQTFSSSTAYFITVLTQPTGPAQTCTLMGAQGFAGTANVTNIDVTCTTDTFAVGGSVSGLAGTGLVLEDNGGDDLTVSANGTFTFATPVANGAAYAVTVKAQPAMPTQTCAISSGSGTVGAEPITNVLVTCTTNTFTVGGSISGLLGTGLVLEDNGGDDLTVSSGSTFTFATPVVSGGAYSVTVKTQPTRPTQTCTVSGGSGTVVAGAVTSITVNCASNTYTVGGVVIGLAGAGLVLQDNGGDNLSVTANGLFAFATPIASGATYAVTVLTQPTGPAQTCTVSGAMGAVSTSNVISVSVNCAANTYALSGTIKGLIGTGLVLVLQDSGGEDLTVMPGATSFSFLSMLASGEPYAISVATQPTSPSQTCAVTGDPSGTIGSAPITDIVVTCTANSYSVGGTVTGLAGSGLVLQNDHSDSLTVNKSGLFSFATPLASGSTYAVAVLTQPTGPTQTCTVSAGTGTVGAGNVVSVVVTCSTIAFPVSGTITGFTGSGLVLQDNGGDSVAVMKGATIFAFPTAVASGATYSVAVATQPISPAQTCVVSNAGTGTIGGAPVTDVVVTCTTDTYPVGGTVLGLMGSGLVLQDNGGDNHTVSENGIFTFATPVASEAAFSVTILTQPSSPAQTCVITGATGTVVNAPVTTVTVNCGLNDYTVSGTTSGLLGKGLVLSLNGGAGLAVESNGTFSFPQALTDETAYTVTILAQPTGPSQTCTLSSANGTIAAANVSNVAVSCSANKYPITVSAVGVAGIGLVLDDNGGDGLAIPASGTYTFATLVASGTPYAISVAEQPIMLSQTCVVGNGSGTVAGGAVSNVTVTCTTNKYTVGGTITGLAGTVVLQDNGADTLILTPPGHVAGAVIVDAGVADQDGGTGDEGGIDGGSGPPALPFTFSASVASGSPYAVTVSQQPGTPNQTCTVTNDPSGTITNAAVNTVAVVCATNTFNVDVTVIGLAGTGLIIGDNAGDMVPVSSNGVVTLPTKQASDTTYTVTVVAQPSAPTQTCTVMGGTGTVGGADVMTVTVNCSTNSYMIGGTISGLTGTGLVMGDNVGDSVPISGNGLFSFPTPYASGAPYAVTVLTQPQQPWQTCTVTNGTGTVTNGNVTNVSVACTTSTYKVSVNLNGLSGSGLQLADNGSDMLSVTQNGLSTFAVSVASAASYSVTVVSQPTSPWQTCTVASGVGTIAGTNVTVAVSCTTNAYVVDVAVSGLLATGVKLLDNGGDTLSATSNSTFAFATSIASGSVYDVTVAAPPTNPTQSCVVASPTGTMAGAPVTVAVSCSTSSFTVGGTITGLAASESVQLTNGTDTISVSANGAFTFDKTVASGAAYSVSATGQPASPIAQTCTIANGSGSVGGGNVTSIAVTCAQNTYTVGGTVTGYSGSGLVLQNNGSASLAIPAGATTFTWPTPLVSGASYVVGIGTQPSSPWQTCTVANASGTIAGANVTSVAVSCTTNTYTVGGSISGLAGGKVVLQDLTSTNTVTVSVDGTFQFPAAASGSTYSVTVQTQPSSPTETCAVTSGTGTIAGAAVTNISVSCATSSFTVGGSISGYSGTGLQLLLNGATTYTATSGASSFTFGSLLASGSAYAVTIATQPSSPTQSCTITNGSGTVGGANVTSIAVACATSSFTVGGEVSGLGSGSVVLQDVSSTNTVTVSSNGTFTFPAQASGSSYAVTVQTQPSSPVQTCSVANGTGTVPGAAVTNIVVTCTTTSYTIGGSISGYAGTGLALQLNGANTLSVTSGATSFTFSSPTVASGAAYAVSVATQPTSPAQVCTTASGSGTVGSANVTSVAITCTTTSFTIGGTVTGLSGNSIVLQNNTSSNTVTVSANGSFSFPAQASGSAYAVTIKTLPTSPTEGCSVANGSGTVTTDNVTNIVVACTTANFTVGGTISGLTGSGMVLLLNGSNNLAVSAGATSFAFGTQITSGGAYAVTMGTQPSAPTQTCTVSNGTGTVGGANITNVAISCTTNSYSISATVTGTFTGSVVLEDNGGNNLTFTSTATETFSTQLASGATYSVTVSTQPSVGTCTVANGSGTVGSANVTNVTVTCANLVSCTKAITASVNETSPFAVGISVSFVMVGGGGGSGSGSGCWAGGGGGGSSAILGGGTLEGYAAGGAGGEAGCTLLQGVSGATATGTFTLAAGTNLTAYVGGGGGGGGWDYGGGGGSGYFGGGGGSNLGGGESVASGAGGSNSGGAAGYEAVAGSSLTGGLGGPGSSEAGAGGSGGTGGAGGPVWDGGGGGGGFGGGGGGGGYGPSENNTTTLSSNGGSTGATAATINTVPGGVGASTWSTATSLPSAAGAGASTDSNQGGNAGLIILTYSAPSCSL